MIEKAIIKALTQFFESKKGEALIGNIVMKAVDQALMREIELEDGKSKPGRTIETREKVNVLDHLAKYLPYIEGAIRGCQTDAAAARNRSSALIGSFNEFTNILAGAAKVKEVEFHKTKELLINTGKESKEDEQA